MTIIKQSDHDITLEVGARIHDLMWRKRINQTQLGQVLGVTQTAASKKLRGDVGITIPELLRIAEFLEVDPIDLLPPGNKQVTGRNPLGLELAA
jgi:DNA-binding Xre family transcriptional regulator